MSKLSNEQGRALEFATLKVFETEISKVRKVKVEKNSSYDSAQRAWTSVDSTLKISFEKCALAAAKVVFDLEPIVLEYDKDTLDLKLQSDQAGKGGDVRDLLIIRSGIKWEIGLSIKHNHFAVKHSRLGSKLDFGEKWFGVKCSTEYWNEVNPIFKTLEAEQKKGTVWKKFQSKDKTVYIPILQAFVSEVERSYRKHGKTIPIKMVEYLLGKYDFYKVIGIDKGKYTKVQAFNLKGTLSKKGKCKKSTCIVPIVNLPNRIVKIGRTPNSNNTVELYLDEGWQFSFRIHNAETKVVPSLKFDIQIIGMPAAILTIDKHWA